MNMKKTLLISTIFTIGLCFLEPICSAYNHNISPEENLINASISGSLDDVFMSINHNVNINVHKDAQGNTPGCSPLMLAVMNDYISIVNVLLNNNADVNDTNDNGNTALIYAALHNNVDAAKILIATGNVKINIRNNKGETALKVAMRKNHLQMIDLLTSNGAQI